MDISEIPESSRVPLREPATTPSATPATVDTAIAVPASNKVAGNRAAMTEATGRPWMNEYPRSPLASDPR